MPGQHSKFSLHQAHSMGQVSRYDSATVRLKTSDEIDWPALVDAAEQGIALLDTEGRIIYANQQLKHEFGILRNDNSVTKSIALLGFHADHQGGDEQQDCRNVVLYRQGSNGEIYRCAIVSHTHAGQRLAVIEKLNANDKQAPTTRRSEPLVNMVTVLPNRNFLPLALDKVRTTISRGKKFAAVAIDLDRFKHINDTLGLEAGDALLKRAAQRIASVIRQDDILIHLDGDEFLILHNGSRQPAAAEAIANRLIELFSYPFLIAGKSINLSASIGIAPLSNDGGDPEALLADANLALYEAKATGKNKFKIYDNALAKASNFRAQMENDLRRACRLKQLALVYQPQINLHENVITGFEALIRWHHPLHGTISPMDFIPLAEELGEIHAIGNWIVETACEELSKWPKHLSVAINVSPIQLESDNFITQIKACLNAHKLEPSRLEIEITENVLMANSNVVHERLWELQDLGISIAMDDFGTGYSSLSYINEFSFAKIKIDQSFIRGDRTAKSDALVGAIINLGKSLNVATIAEGIESQEQLSWLLDSGCMFGQGYYFSPPIPATEICKFISDFSPESE